MSETLIRVDGISKRFCRSLKRSLWYGLKDLGSELRGHRHGSHGQLRKDEFWAVKDIHFELKRGECLGLIGHNGAGKTTLLRILNGLIKPDQGRIEMRGRTGALIALGAGFNPILTGRENIYINASVLGLSKHHVDRKLEEIIAFAEIGDFLDTPVRNYSSGMRVRLGFAVAAVLIEPDILFLDEVLAVGDIGFKIKALNVVRELTRNSAVVLVSHNMQQISTFCTRAMLMGHGKVMLDTDDVDLAIDQYYALVQHNAQTSGSGGASVLDMHLLLNGERVQGDEPSIQRGNDAAVVLRVQINGPDSAANLSINVFDQAMNPIIASPVLTSEGKLLSLPPGEHELHVPMGPIDLNGGKYSFTIALRDAETRTTLARTQGLCPFRVLAEGAYWGNIIRPVRAQTTERRVIDAQTAVSSVHEYEARYADE